MESNLNSSLTKFNEAKTELEKAILEHPKWDKYEKLEAIKNHRLWPFHYYIGNLGAEWEQRAILIEREMAIRDGKDPEKDYICRIVDNHLTDPMFNDRHQVVYYSDLIKMILDNYEYGEYPDGLVTVASNRGNYGAKVQIPYMEVIDTIYNYAVNNKQIGFTVDW